MLKVFKLLLKYSSRMQSPLDWDLMSIDVYFPLMLYNMKWYNNYVRYELQLLEVWYNDLKFYVIKTLETKIIGHEIRKLDNTYWRRERTDDKSFVPFPLHLSYANGRGKAKLNVNLSMRGINFEGIFWFNVSPIDTFQEHRRRPSLSQGRK